VTAEWRLAVAETCIGSGSCTGVAPGHFVLGPDHRSHPVTAEVAPDGSVLDAAASCPVEAISIVELATGAAIEP
jgi:ferredoxin